MQRAADRAGVERPRLGERACRGQVHEGPDLAVALGDAGQAGLHQLDRAELAACEALCGVPCRQAARIELTH